MLFTMIEAQINDGMGISLGGFVPRSMQMFTREVQRVFTLTLNANFFVRHLHVSGKDRSNSSVFSCLEEQTPRLLPVTGKPARARLMGVRIPN